MRSQTSLNSIIFDLLYMGEEIAGFSTTFLKCKKNYCNLISKNSMFQNYSLLCSIIHSNLFL